MPVKATIVKVTKLYARCTILANWRLRNLPTGLSRMLGSLIEVSCRSKWHCKVGHCHSHSITSRSIGLLLIGPIWPSVPFSPLSFGKWTCPSCCYVDQRGKGSPYQNLSQRRIPSYPRSSSEEFAARRKPASQNAIGLLNIRVYLRSI